MCTYSESELLGNHVQDRLAYCVRVFATLIVARWCTFLGVVENIDIQLDRFVGKTTKVPGHITVRVSGNVGDIANTNPLTNADKAMLQQLSVRGRPAQATQPTIHHPVIVHFLHVARPICAARLEETQRVLAGSAVQILPFQGLLYEPNPTRLHEYGRQVMWPYRRTDDNAQWYKLSGRSHNWVLCCCVRA